MSATDAVCVTTIVAVEPETAFEVFTEEVDAWWKRGPRYRRSAGTLRFEPGVGGRLVEISDADGAEVYEHGRILVWKPADRLVWEQQDTEVEVRFERIEQGTRITIEHRGWDAIPDGAPVRHGLTGTAFINMMGLWWADLLASARNRANAGPDPKRRGDAR